MSELNIIESMPAEETDLKLHVDLCAQRYNQLIDKFDEVDNRLEEIETMCRDIKDTITNVKANAQDVYLKWAGFIIILLTGACGALLGRLL